MLKNLQLEFVIFEIRKLIYTNENDLFFFEKVLKAKKKRILDIGLKNSVETIFTSPELRESIYKEIYIKPYPNFKYRSSEENARFRLLDEYNYYKQAAEFMDSKGDVYIFEEIIGGTDECIVFTLKGKKIRVDKDKIFRKLKGFML